MPSTMAGSKLAQSNHNLPHRTNPAFPDGPSHSNDRDDWEDWSDEDPYTADDGEDLLVVLEDAEGSLSPRSRKAPLPSRKSSVLLPENAYAAASRPERLRSRARQKAQNTHAGIKVVTDMTKFRKQRQQQLKMSAEADPRHGQFADLAALQALEGDQSQSSVGSWHWRKKMQATKASGGKSRMSRLRAEGAPGSAQQDLSPSDRPIMIGLAFASDEAGGRAAAAAASPQSSLAETPVGWPGRNQRYLPGQRNEQAQMRSVWSPDTEDTDSPRTLSAISPQTGNIGSIPRNAPPVPAVPPSFRERQRIKDAQDEDEYDDNFTPVTLFEEDGSSIISRKPTTKSTKSTRSKEHARSPATSVGTPSGWWDHIRSPFVEQASITPAIEQAHNNPFKPQTQNRETEAQSGKDSADPDEWWVEQDTKKGHPAGAAAARPLSISVAAANMAEHRTKPSQQPSPVVASSSRNTPNTQPNPRFETEARPDTQASAHPQQSHSEKARILAQENEAPTEQPPPYSPPNKQVPLRYRAVFPPGHPLCSQFPPSPGPVSPGLASTMTSQGAINMTEVPLTPAADRPSARAGARDAPLPTRAPGTYPTGDQFLAAVGGSPAARVERQRQRHEKEDAAARKVGGFWRGRGCIPESGCYGRSGREGRKRRRVWLGVCLGVILIIVLITVLLVVLLPRKGQAAPQESIWLNLTNYPPVPTGVLSVVGADNSEIATTCVAPTTLWSCTLPKDQQAANKPYQADQPTFVIQIQFDNSTRQFWNVPDGVAPTFTPLPTGQVNNGFGQPAQTAGSAVPTAGLGAGFGPRNLSMNAGKRNVSGRPTLTGRAAAGIKALLGRDGAAAANPNFTPVPAPPSFQDMWFLGNTTDKIRSGRKAGEATPFFISLLPSLNSSAGPNALARRGLGNGISSFDPIVNDSARAADVDRLVPKPDVKADGTPASARMFPRQILQQPLRLFDRGLETEHYGFYTYFNKTIYVKSLDGPSNETERLGEVPADRDGGALPSEAKHIVIWGWTRFHVQIWTRRGNSTRLLSRDGRGTEGMGEKQAREARRPGTFPYPITVREDTHGGDRDGKGTVTYNITNRGQFDMGSLGLQFNNVGAGGEWINPRGLGFNPSYGGIDGGTGGCKCAWTNFLNLGGRAVGQRM